MHYSSEGKIDNVFQVVRSIGVGQVRLGEWRTGKIDETWLVETILVFR